MSFVEGGGDRFGIANLNRITCPDCGKAYLVKLKKEPNKLICTVCQLLISDDQLLQEITLVPQQEMGISITEKPYFNQIGANTRYLEPDGRPMFSLDDMSNKDRLKQYSFATMDDQKHHGMKISRRGRRYKPKNEEEDKTFEVVYKMLSKYGTDVKVELF